MGLLFQHVTHGMSFKSQKAECEVVNSFHQITKNGYFTLKEAYVRYR